MHSVHALGCICATALVYSFHGFLITTSGSCYPHARNYAICWPSSHTEYRTDCVTGGGFPIYHVQGLTSKVKVITRGEATRLINKEDAVVVDLRQRDDFRKGHIAGATNLLPSEIKPTMLANWKSTKTSRLYRGRRFWYAVRESA